jgi:Ca2+-binding RTX toxin-like protein
MASDPDGEDVSINPMTIPSWMHVELSAPGLLEVRGTPGPLDGGDAAAIFSIRATDGKSFTEQNFTLPVSVRAASLNSAGTLTVNGDANDNAIHAWVRNGNTVRVDRDGTIKDFDLASVKNVEVYGVDGNDDILLNLGAIPAYALGGAGNDTLTGGDEYDNFVGGGGKDNLSGGLGDDHLTRRQEGRQSLRRRWR